MPRRIITIAYHAAGGPVTPDTYFDRVIKYIPADIVAAWVAVTGAVKSATNVPKDVILWVAFGLGIPLTAAWTYRQTQEPGHAALPVQVAISTGAFIVWVFALGEPFSYAAWYNPVYGSLLIILYTLLVGLVRP